MQKLIYLPPLLLFVQDNFEIIQPFLIIHMRFLNPAAGARLMPKHFIFNISI